MSEFSGPFNTHTDFDEAVWDDFMANILTNGVFKGGKINQTAGGDLAVSAGGGLAVNVATGVAMVGGFFYRNDATKGITLTVADASLNRIDRIILHLDLTARIITAQKKDGTPSGSPTPPALTMSGTVVEISLAQILVAANASSISSGDITDERSYCTATLAPGAVTDTALGNRTITDSATPSGDSGTPTNLFSWLGHMLKAITGKTNWRAVPDITLAALNSHHARHASAGADPIAPSDIGAPSLANNNTYNGTQTINQTLGGSTKTFLFLNATDAKLYAITEGPSGAGGIFNTTDNIGILSWGPTATLAVGGVTVAVRSGTVQTNLNADQVDGMDASDFLGVGAKAADSDKLDGLDSTAFVLVAPGGGFANRDIGVGPIGSRPAAGHKGRIYIETPFS